MFPRVFIRGRQEIRVGTGDVTVEAETGVMRGKDPELRNAGSLKSWKRQGIRLPQHLYKEHSSVAIL